MGMLVYEIVVINGFKLMIKFICICENFVFFLINILYYGFLFFCVLWNEICIFYNECLDELLNLYGFWLIRMKGF